MSSALLRRLAACLSLGLVLMPAMMVAQEQGSGRNDPFGGSSGFPGSGEEAGPGPQVLDTTNYSIEEILQQKVTFDFEGGYVEDFVELLRRPTDQHYLNLIVHQKVRRIAVPAVSLRQIHIDAALTSLTELTGGKIVCRPDQTNSFLVIERNDQQEQENLKVLNVGRFLLEPSQEDATDMVISAAKQAQLLSAIEVGLEMLENNLERPEFRLHPETCLLFVKGEPEAVAVIEQVVNQLMPIPVVGGGMGLPGMGSYPGAGRGGDGGSRGGGAGGMSGGGGPGMGGPGMGASGGK